jgi:hypothetical protein
LLRIFRHRNVEFIITPFISWAQVIYFFILFLLEIFISLPVLRSFCSTNFRLTSPIISLNKCVLEIVRRCTWTRWHHSCQIFLSSKFLTREKQVILLIDDLTMLSAAHDTILDDFLLEALRGKKEALFNSFNLSLLDILTISRGDNPLVRRQLAKYRDRRRRFIEAKLCKHAITVIVSPLIDNLVHNILIVRQRHLRSILLHKHLRVLHTLVESPKFFDKDLIRPLLQNI